MVSGLATDKGPCSQSTKVRRQVVESFFKMEETGMCLIADGQEIKTKQEVEDTEGERG